MSSNRKSIGFLSFGHWSPTPGSGTRSAAVRIKSSAARSGVSPVMAFIG